MIQEKNIKAGLIITIISAIAFGLYPASIQFALKDGVNISFVIILSTFLRALSLSIFCKIKKFKIIPPRDEMKSYFTGGLFQAISVGGIISSLVFIPGPVTITILFTHTLMLLFLLGVKREQKLTYLALFSALGAFLGVTFVVNLWGSGHGGLDYRGIILALIAAVATASRLYVFGLQLRDVNPALVGARIFIVTFLFILLISLFQFPTPPNSILGLFWLFAACASLIIGTFGMFYGIALLGSFRFSLLIKLEPIFTALFSYLILKETLLPMQYFGMALVLISLFIFNIRHSKAL